MIAHIRSSHACVFVSVNCCSYRVRAFISQHLLQHHGFDFVAVEGDHPDTYQLNRYVQMHAGCKFKSAEEAMGSYKRYPRQCIAPVDRSPHGQRPWRTLQLIHW